MDFKQKIATLSIIAIMITTTLTMVSVSQTQQNKDDVKEILSLKSELSTVYHYVGADTDSSPDYLSIFAPFNVTVKFFDQNDTLRATKSLTKGTTAVYSLDDFGFSDLYYVRLESTGFIAVTIMEWFSGDEIGYTTPQTILHTIYLLANGDTYAGDDFIRIFSQNNTKVTFYDQTLTPLTTKYVSGGNVVQYKASDLGFANDYSMIVVSDTPIAISWLDGPGLVALMIPQGIK